MCRSVRISPRDVCINIAAAGHAVSAVLALAGVGCTWVRGWRGANTPHSCSRGQKLSPAPGILRGAPDRSLEKVSMKSLESELLIVVSVLRRYYS